MPSSRMFTNWNYLILLLLIVIVDVVVRWFQYLKWFMAILFYGFIDSHKICFFIFSFSSIVPTKYARKKTKRKKKISRQIFLHFVGLKSTVRGNRKKRRRKNTDVGQLHMQDIYYYYIWSGLWFSLYIRRYILGSLAIRK